MIPTFAQQDDPDLVPAGIRARLAGVGVPVKAVSEMLGHSDVATTLRIYSHVLPTMHDAAAETMDRLFGS